MIILTIQTIINSKIDYFKITVIKLILTSYLSIQNNIEIKIRSNQKLRIWVKYTNTNRKFNKLILNQIFSMQKKN
jgi:hypothetical protein